MDIQQDVINLVSDVLSLQSRKAELAASTPLAGAMPEFDSMAVVGILTALEDHYGFVIHDDEIEASIFETLGTLSEFVRSKLAA